MQLSESGADTNNGPWALMNFSFGMNANEMNTLK